MHLLNAYNFGPFKQRDLEKTCLYHLTTLRKPGPGPVQELGISTVSDISSSLVIHFSRVNFTPLDPFSSHIWIDWEQVAYTNFTKEA